MTRDWESPRRQDNSSNPPSPAEPPEPSDRTPRRLPERGAPPVQPYRPTNASTNAPTNAPTNVRVFVPQPSVSDKINRLIGRSPAPPLAPPPAAAPTPAPPALQSPELIAEPQPTAGRSRPAQARSPQARSPQARPPQARRKPIERRRLGEPLPSDWIPPGSPEEPPPRPKRRWRIPLSWQFWAVLAVLLTSGVGVFALALLLKLPALPNCPSIFWPTASASLRLYCAQLAANKETVDDLLHAIELVDSLPDDHPLRPEINANIEQWSLAILELADEQFQQGKLDEAIQLARKIPTDTTAHEQVAEKIRQWRSIWAEAEKIYNEAEEAMLAQDLRAAFAIATRLLDVGNTYWETTKYQELNLLITASREDGAKLARARRLVSRGGRSNLLEAIALAKEILPASPAYAVAQRLIGEIAEDMLQLAERRIDAGNTDDAIALAREIPPEAGLQAQVQDLIALGMAVAQAANGTMPDLEAAIIQVQRFNNSSRFYSKAQQLISRWQLEIQAVNRLDMARQMAQPGDVASLSAAIAEARQVPSGNPRYGDARDAIAEWTAAIETIEDRPYLNQAQDLARPGDPASLQAAINTARQIREGRALSGEAQRLIQTWTAQIQRSQDQPYLDEARRLAAAGNIPAAIATAQQIQAGRSLYDSAQDEIRTWRAQTEGQTRLREAYDTASIGTAPMLLSAIRIADQVPRNNAARAEADRMINAWSQSMLDIAQSQAQVDLQTAIAIAASIPPRTEAYAAAQLRIQEWQQQTPVPSP